MEEVDQAEDQAAEPEPIEEITPFLNDMSLQEFADQDQAFLTCSSLGTESDWEEQLINRDISGFESDKDDEDENNTTEDQPPVVSVCEAAKMVEALRRFGCKYNKPEIVDATLDIERSVMEIEFEKQKQAKQSLITNFFH